MDNFNPFSLSGKKIIITGASSGIGQQCAIDCSKMGAKVIVMGRNEDRLEETMNQLSGDGHKKVAFDINKIENLPLIINDIISNVGLIDGVLHCAGISGLMPLKLAKKETIDFYMNTNVISPIELTREVLKKKNFSLNGGAVIFISSVMGVVGEKAKFIYSMTKGALISGIRSLALEYAEKKIRFNCISPGVILTPINANQPYLMNAEKREIVENSHPLGIGETSDISCAAIYLLSDASRWVTGQNFIIDGGYTTH